MLCMTWHGGGCTEHFMFGGKGQPTCRGSCNAYFINIAHLVINNAHLDMHKIACAYAGHLQAPGACHGTAFRLPAALQRVCVPHCAQQPLLQDEPAASAAFFCCTGELSAFCHAQLPRSYIQAWSAMSADLIACNVSYAPGTCKVWRVQAHVTNQGEAHMTDLNVLQAGITPLCANIVARTLGANVGEGTDSILEGLEVSTHSTSVCHPSQPWLWERRSLVQVQLMSSGTACCSQNHGYRATCPSSFDLPLCSVACREASVALVQLVHVRCRRY